MRNGIWMTMVDRQSTLRMTRILKIIEICHVLTLTHGIINALHRRVNSFARILSLSSNDRNKRIKIFVLETRFITQPVEGFLPRSADYNYRIDTDLFTIICYDKIVRTIKDFIERLIESVNMDGIKVYFSCNY